MEESLLEQTVKLFGQLTAERSGSADFETNRNTNNIDLFEAIIREAYNDVKTVVAGHHIMFTQKGQPLPTEIPSADTFIFNHDIAKIIWRNQCEAMLTKLALEPAKSRDALLRELYYNR